MLRDWLKSLLNRNGRGATSRLGSYRSSRSRILGHRRARTAGQFERLELRYAMDATSFDAKFDFGTASSPLESGYTRVTERSSYSANAGFGWSAGSIVGYDRAIGSAVTRDFNFTNDGTFLVNVPNGVYRVNAVLGDTGIYAHDQVGVYLESTLRDTVTTSARQIVTRAYEVTVVDSQLTLQLRDLGGRDRNCVIEALEVTLLAPEQPTLSVEDISVNEGASGEQSMAFTVTLSQPSTQVVQLQYATQDGSATAGSDYLATAGILEFPAGTTTRAIYFQVLGDTVVEPAESFKLLLSNPTGAKLARTFATATIQNDDVPQIITVDVSAGPYSESRTTAITGTVRHNGSTSNNVIVTLTSSDTSEASVPGSVIIPAGQSSAVFFVQIVDDAEVDGNQSVVITASAVGFANGFAPIQVTDDEQPPFFRMFDFATSATGLVNGAARVSQSTMYSATSGYGWTGGRIFSADRGGAAVIRDFIYTNDGTFVTDVPNGSYTVDMVLGDVGSYSHDNMGVYLEGVLVDTVSTVRGVVTSRTFRVQVADGQLTLRVRDLGGSDTNVVLEGLRIYSSASSPSRSVYWPSQVGIQEAVFTSPVINSEGFTTYAVYSKYERSVNTIRVLLPANYDPAKLYHVVYVLPVEARDGRQFGDGLVTARSYSLQNTYDAIMVAPTFTDIPWYANHASDPSIWQETYFRDVVVPFVETQFKTVPGAAGRYLLGFSKSGYGAVSLLLRNQDYFGRAIAWDSPLAMSNPSTGYGFTGIVGTQQNFAQNYQITSLLNTLGLNLKNQPPRIFLLGYATTYGAFYDHQAVAAQMSKLGIPHVYDPGILRNHVWNSGWMPDAMRMLFS